MANQPIPNSTAQIENVVPGQWKKTSECPPKYPNTAISFNDTLITFNGITLTFGG